MSSCQYETYTIFHRKPPKKKDSSAKITISPISVPLNETDHELIAMGITEIQDLVSQLDIARGRKSNIESLPLLNNANVKYHASLPFLLSLPPEKWEPIPLDFLLPQWTILAKQINQLAKAPIQI